MDNRTRSVMRKWLIRLHTKLQKGDTFKAGEWAGLEITGCIVALDDDELQREWGSYQC